MLRGRYKYFALPLFLIGVVLIVFLQFISGRSINKLIVGNTTLLNDLKVQTDLKKLESDIVVLESNMRGAVITNNPEYSIGVEGQVQLIHNEINDVSKKIRDKPVSGLMIKLNSLIEEKINFCYLVLKTLREKGKEPAELLITTNRGQILRDSIVNVISVLDNTRRTEMARIIGSIDESGKRAWSWGLVLAFIAGTTCLIAFWHFVSQGRQQRKMISVLDASERKIKEAARVQEQFMANMSHEIRTPMNAILGFTNLLYKTDLDENQGQYVQNIQSSGENLLSIVNDILDLSKIEAGMMRIESVPFSLRGLMHSVETMFIEKVRQKQLSLRVEIDKSIPDMLCGDAVRLTQILVNLLGNAIKFTIKGGIEINIKSLKQDADNLRLLFSVRDTGIGIAAEKQKAIFERFQQAEAETTRRYGGTGLGLAIVNQLINLQKGQISVKSNVGRGTEFIFELPFEISKEIVDDSMIQYRQTHPDHQFYRARILVAEDNLLNQQLMIHLLASWKMDFEIVNNGLEALKVLQSEDFDMVLMDIQMPDLDGYTATQKIRGDLKSSIPIIAMTAHAMAGEKEKCLNYGMNDYISKPVKESELYKLVIKYAKKDEEQESGKDTVINLNYLKELSNGNRDFEKEIISQFIKQVPEEISSLQNAIAQKNFRNIQQLAHCMKSSVSYLGLTNELEPLLQEIEDQASDGADLFIIHSCFDAVQYTCRQAVEQAGQMLQQY